MFNAVCDPASLAFVSLEALTLESVVIPLRYYLLNVYRLKNDLLSNYILLLVLRLKEAKA